MRRPALWWIASLAVLLVAGGGVWWFGLRHHTARQPAWVPYHSAALHYRAAFPEQPVVEQTSYRVAGVTVSLDMASDPDRHIVVGAFTTSVGVRPAMLPALMSEMQGDRVTDGLVLDHQEPTSYSGHPAQRAVFYTADDTSITVVDFIDHDRAFLLAAPTGASFARLSASFALTR